MTVTITLHPETEARLSTQASKQGLSLDQYLIHLIEAQAPTDTETPLTPTQRAAAWRDSVRALPPTTPLLDEAISRESLYDARG